MVKSPQLPGRPFPTPALCTAGYPPHSPLLPSSYLAQVPMHRATTALGEGRGMTKMTQEPKWPLYHRG